MKTIKKNSWPLYAVLLSGAMIILIMASYHLVPFGNKLFFPGDLASQYMPFTQLIQQLIHNPSDLLYSFSNGLGSNMISLLSYYLTSPFNLLLIFCSQSHLLEGVSLLVALKFILASGTMSYYLQSQKQLKSLWNPVLSICYSFCGFATIYFYNTLWLDVLIWLPLVVCGLERYLKDGKVALYQWSLFFLLLSNYYMAWMVCLFLGIYFFYYRMKLTGNALITVIKKDWRLFLSFIGRSAVLVMILGIIYIPTIAGMLSTGKGNLDLTKLFIPFFQSHLFALTGFGFGTGNFTLRLDHQPLMYFGLFPLALSLVSLFKKHRTRNSDFFLIISLFLCTLITPLTMIFQLLQPAAGFPFRFTYLISFVMIMFVAEGIVEHRLTKQRIQKTLLFLGIGFLCLYGLSLTACNQMHPFIKEGVLLSSLFCLLWWLLFFIKKKTWLTALCLGLTLVEVFGQTLVTMQATPMVNQDQLVHYSKNYQQSLPKETEVLTRVDNTMIQESHYGLDLTGYNNGLWFNYRGVSAYTSTLNAENLKLSAMLGTYSWNERRFSHFGATPLVDLILGVNTRLIESHHGFYAQPLGNQETAFVLQQPLILHSGAYIQNQNQLATALFNQRVFSTASIIKMKKSKTTLHLTVKVNKTGPLYLQLPEVKLNSDDHYLLQKNGHPLSLPLEIKNTALVPLGVAKQGEEITLDIASKKEQSFRHIEVATFDQAHFQKGRLKMTGEKIKLNHLRAKTTLIAKKQTSALLAIPYDKDWQAEVNGKKVTPKASQLGLIELPLQTGKNDIELHYVPKAFYMGCVLSLVGVIIEIVISIIGYRKNKRYLKNK